LAEQAATTAEMPLSRFDARDYLRMVLRRWWFILSIGLAAALVGGFIAWGMPKTYRATATVFVPQEPQGVFLLGGGQPPAERIALETQAVIAEGNEVAVRTAKALAERTVGQKIVVDPSEITQAVTATVKPPNLILVEAVSQDPYKAKEFANQTAASFLEVMDELRQKQSTNAQRYLDKQVEKTRAELEELLLKKRQYQRMWGITAITTHATGTAPGQGQTVTIGGETPDFRGELHEAQANLASAQARVRALEAAYRQAAQQKTTRSVAANPTYTSLLDQLNTAQVALVQLRARYTPEHPAVVEMATRVEEIQAALAKTPATVEVTSPVDPARVAALQTELRAARQSVAELSARVASLQGTVAATEARRSDLLDKEGILEQLQDQIALKRAAYQELLTQLEAKKLSVASERGRSAMVDGALTARATSPNPLRTLIFSLALGLVLGFALVLLLETLDDTVRRPEDLTRDPEIRFLGVIPWTGEAMTELVMLAAPKSPPAEAFRTLRSNINFATIDRRPGTILVTSAGASEGKSVTAANLAISFAQAGESVLILDTDLRRPTQHNLFGVEASVGLTNVLVGELSAQQAIQDTAVEGLRILPSGPLPPNPAELLDSARMGALLQELRTVANIIVLDSPPAIMLTDALVLAAQVDWTILVAAAGQVTREAFDEMVRLMRHARGNILGVVLNKLRLTAGDYYYYYYYYYYDYSRPRREPSTGPRRPESATPAAPAAGGPPPPPPSEDELPF